MDWKMSEGGKETCRKGVDGQGRNIRWVGWTLKDEEEISERWVGKGKNGGLFIVGGGKTVRRAMVHEWENVRRGSGKLVGSGGWARGKCKTGRVGEDKSVKRGRLARQKNCAHWIIFFTTVEKLTEPERQFAPRPWRI